MTHTLPAFRSVLVVCAHPDDESFGLGAILSTLADAGSQLSVLCFTHGEASTLHGADGDLGAIRAGELRDAGNVLGVNRVELLDYPDGALSAVALDELTGHVHRVAADVDADVLLVFDYGGITGHPDHQHATDAALAATHDLGLPVLAWVVPAQIADSINRKFGTGFVGRGADEIDIAIAVHRIRQLDAIRRHRSQSADNPVLWHRLELLGPSEHLRYLNPASASEAFVATPSSNVDVERSGGEFPCSQPLRDEHRALLPELAAVRAAADAVGRSDGPEHAARARRLLARHLVPHMIAEEMVLYPAIDRLGGCDVTATLRLDHDEIRRLTAMLDQHRDSGSGEELRAALYGLDAVVRLHLAAEEAVLYPVLDERLDNEQAAEVISGMHQVERRLYRDAARAGVEGSQIAGDDRDMSHRRDGAFRPDDVSDSSPSPARHPRPSRTRGSKPHASRTDDTQEPA